MAMALAQLDARGPPPARPPRAGRWPGTRPRILLCTEGTYPYVMGGVSSWCDLLVNGLDEFDWLVLPIVAPGKREPLFALPPQAREVGPHRGVVGGAAARGGCAGEGRDRGRASRPSLVRHLIGWEGDPAELLDAFIACRRHPAGRAPRVPLAAAAGARTCRRSREVLDERIPEAGTPPRMDLVEAAALYQTLYWVARTAAAPTPHATCCT